MKNRSGAILFLIITGVIIMLSCKNEKEKDNDKEDNKLSNPLSLRAENLVSQKVLKDKSLHSCVISIHNGDETISLTVSEGMESDTPYYIASITKLFTAVIVMKLAEEGRLTLDDPMADYLPSDLIDGIHIYKKTDYSSQIKVKQLLSHTSGIPDYYSELFKEFQRNPEKKWSVEETIAYARDNMSPGFIPGTKASYSDTNFQLLGKIIEQVTDKPLATVYEEYIFDPLQLNNTRLVGFPREITDTSQPVSDIYSDDIIVTKIRENGSYWADGGIISTADDCIIFLKALRNGKLISKESLEMMHQWEKIEFPLQYGYGTMYFNLPKMMNRATNIPAMWGHSGSSGSFLYYCEEKGFYLAGTINQTEGNIKPFFLMRDIMEEALQE